MIKLYSTLQDDEDLGESNDGEEFVTGFMKKQIERLNEQEPELNTDMIGNSIKLDGFDSAGAGRNIFTRI